MSSYVLYMFKYRVNNIQFGKVLIIKDKKEKYINTRIFFSTKMFQSWIWICWKKNFNWTYTRYDFFSINLPR